tara:strand:+ start:287 stop:463 length:177 start_codon:yes stop_codon:yes gene_type:complete
MLIGRRYSPSLCKLYCNGKKVVKRIKKKKENKQRKKKFKGEEGDFFSIWMPPLLKGDS